MKTDIDTFQKITNNFTEELENSAVGRKTSLTFIVHKLPAFSIVKKGETFQVIVVGGSISQNAFIEKTGEDKFEIVSQAEKKLPSFANREDFLLFCEREIASDVSVVGMNFAYPIKPVFKNGELDGSLVRGTKGQTFRGLTGKLIGEEVEKHFKAKGKKIKVSVANDTVCLLLSGLARKKWNSLAAGVIGTGMNFAIFLGKDKLVNLESANFDKFDQTATGQEIDSESSHKGLALFEKEVAGVYLYKHFNKELVNRRIDFPAIEDSEELTTIAENDIKEVSDLAREILERSAALTACQVAGILDFQKRNLTFVIEGSLFWKGYQYHENVQKYVKKLSKYKATFVEIKNSSVVGAANLVI